MEQKIILTDSSYTGLIEYIQQYKLKKILLVCEKIINLLQIGNFLISNAGKIGFDIILFSDFQPNPSYESVVKGVKLFHQKHCDCIFAIGGGSAMDVAKCIKLYSNMNPNKNYLHQKIIPNDVKLLVAPTTAGTGSEATRFAVIYYNGEKQSVTNDSCIPSAVFIDASALKTLPEYQRKATMLDAFCHAIESFWSVNSTEESKLFSKEAITMILSNMDGYLKNKWEQNAAMLCAANLAGKAINITQTTAGHAMCYKLTSMYWIAHGHAAALCVRILWRYMIDNTALCTDPRGKEYLENVFAEIADAMGCMDAREAAEKFYNIYDELGLKIPDHRATDFDILISSVNPVRLKNNPIALTADAIELLYWQILRKEK